ncbi:MAG: helix-turn-helix domain-containing protein [Alphaproteobacteria bacterium]|nr:helix-turn-helix domain-containing protein [Alphaproteobacteria bacterium]
MRAPHSMRERPDAILPSKKDAELATESSRILSALKGDGAFRVQLEGGQELVLPSAVKTLLMHLLTEMSRGNAVTIIPIHAELTTQEAADVLNVSRPYLIGLLEKGELPHHMVGTHRRVKFEDISAYRKKREQQREEAMEELAKQAQEMGMGY